MHILNLKYGLLMLMQNYWTSTIINLVGDKIKKTFRDYVDELQLAKERSIVMNMKISTTFSNCSNQLNVKHLGYRKKYKNFILDKVTPRIVGEQEMVFCPLIGIEMKIN